MNSLPVTLGPRAAEDLRGLPSVLRPAVLEQLARIGADYFTCSRPAAFPRAGGWESALWCRHPGGAATLVEVLFLLVVEPPGLFVRRVLVRELDRLPGWVVSPAEWGGYPPPPVIDL